MTDMVQITLDISKKSLEELKSTIEATFSNIRVKDIEKLVKALFEQEINNGYESYMEYITESGMDMDELLDGHPQEDEMIEYLD